MPFVLTLGRGRGPGGRETRTLSTGTLSIGRGAGNDWVLPDPERHLSKTHCVVSLEGGRCVLTDLSTNGVYVNGATQPTARDGRVVLTDGDEFRVGEYAFAVAEVDDVAGGLGADADPFGAGRPLAAAMDTLGPTRGTDAGPLDVDPLDAPLGRSSEFQHPLAHSPPARRAEDPFDLADERGADERGADERGAGERRHAPDAEDDLFRGATPLESWQGPAQPDHADAPAHAFSAPKPIPPANPADMDFDALIGDLSPGQPPPHAVPRAPAPQAAAPSPFDELDDLLGDAPPAQPAASPAPAAAGAPAEPAPLLPPEVAPEVSPPPAAHVGGAEAEAAANRPSSPPPPLAPEAGRLLAAFLAGAGVPDLAPTKQDAEAVLRAAGEVFRAMVEGLREVLISRAAVKNEFRVEQTMLRARDNNALKFSVTAEDATAALLQPGRPGYKPPLDATREAFDDLRSHEMAVMAGVQTALIGLLRRFDPDALEQRLQPRLLGNLLPASRKARTWELFCATYKDIAREAEDDFQSVFGREFARAYAAQVRKV